MIEFATVKMFHKLFVFAVLFIAVFNAAFGIDCSHVRCDEGEPTLCAFESTERCYLSLRKCALDGLKCAFDIEYTIVDDTLCAESSNMCF